MRQVFENNEAIWRKCSFYFDEEGHRVELEFEVVERVQSGEEHLWTAFVEGDDDLFSTSKTRRS